MTQHPLISVVMPVYNQEKYIGEALESVINQTYTNLQILVSDDGSKDNSLGIIKEYAAKDSRIQLLNNDKNLGICANFNKLFDNVKGEYIAFFSGDDVMMPGKIAAQYEILESNPDVVAVHHNAWFIDDKGRKSGMHLEKFVPLKNPLDWALKVDWFHAKRIAPLLPTSCLARSSYYLQARYDARFKYKHELLFTIEDYNNNPAGKWVYIKEPMMLYRRHEENFTQNPAFTSHINREKELLAEIAADKFPALKGRIIQYRLFTAYEGLLFGFYDADTMKKAKDFFAHNASLSQKLYLGIAKKLVAVGAYWKVSNMIHSYLFKPFY